MKKYPNKTKIRLNARKLIRLRADREWTQAVAARNAGISRPCYINAESGGAIQAAMAGKIAKLYGHDVDELEAQSA